MPPLIGGNIHVRVQLTNEMYGSDYYFLVILNPLTAGAAYIKVVFIYYKHIKYQLLNMLKIRCDINQQYLKTVYLHFVKSE